MKALSVALLLLAVLAIAEARPTMRVLNKKPAHASASATAVAKEGAKASADAAAVASDGGIADADSTAYAVGDGAEADSSAGAYADDWGLADADSKAVAVGDGAHADSDAYAYADGEVKAIADSKAVAYGDDATAYSDAIAKGNAKSTAYAVAYGEEDDGDDGYHYKYYPYPYYHYYPTAGDDNDDAGDDPYYYYYHGYHGYKAVDPEVKYPYYGHYVVVKEEEAEEEELTPVKFVDPTILAYYAQKVYDYGCYEGKYYRCTYDESCGACPFGYFCGEKTEEVCENVEVWTKKCDPKPTKRCVPDLSPCGTGFCKYNEKCTADYYWCGANWCTPKYSCVAVEAPKKCVWELKDGKKVQTCTDYAPEACAAGKPPCAIGDKCTEDPCTMVKSIVQKCAPKTLPVCVAYDVPIYKTLYKECGPGYCHPGYKCESFEHDSCVVKVVHTPVYYGYDPVYYDPVDASPVVYDDDDADDSLPYIPHYYGDDGKDSATVTATAVSKSTPHGAVSYSNVDAYATGDGVASGWAGADASNGHGDSAHSGSDATASKDKSTAESTTSTTGYGVAVGEATGTYDGDDK